MFFLWGTQIIATTNSNRIKSEKVNFNNTYDYRVRNNGIQSKLSNERERFSQGRRSIPLILSKHNLFDIPLFWTGETKYTYVRISLWIQNTPKDRLEIKVASWELFEPNLYVGINF